MKKVLIGLIAGIILTTGVFAELSVLVSPYPILFNGQPAEVEAYNINGRTFLALGDVAKYFNATAILNESTKEIEITGNTTVQTPSESVVSTVKTTSDGIEIIVVDGIECIKPLDINRKYWINSERSFEINIEPQNNGKISLYLFEPDSISVDITMPEFKTDKRTLLIDDIPFIEVKSEIRTYPSKYYILKDYYLDSILPLIDIDPLY